MPDLKTTVSFPSATVENMSRHDMLEWVNSTVHGQYKKIEELCSGVAYCQMMELLFPNSVGLKKMKSNPKLEHEFLHNLKLFQAAFTKLNFDKSVPIDRLTKGKFQDNFEFLQWFKKFFDTHSAGNDNLKVPAALAAAAQNPPKPIRKAGTQTIGAKGGSTKSISGKVDVLKTPKNSKHHEEKALSPSEVSVLQETKEQLAAQIAGVEIELNRCYKKLVKIEQLLNESIKDDVYKEWCTTALEILYAVDGNEPAGGDDAAFGEEESTQISGL